MSDRLRIVPHEDSGSLLTANADENFLRALLTVSYALGDVSFDRNTDDADQSRVLTIPRGGLLVGKAVTHATGIDDQVIVNDGMTRIPNKPLLRPDLSPKKRITIADGIIGTGNSAKKLISAAYELSVSQGVKPEVSLVVPVASANSLYGDENLLDWARKNRIDLKIITSHVEEEAEYVTFDLDDGGKKTVLIVGKVIRDGEGNFAGCEIGDYGDMTMALMEQNYYESVVAGTLGLLR